MMFPGMGGLPLGGYLMPQYTHAPRPVREVEKVFRSLPTYGTDETPNDNYNKQEDSTMEMGNFMQGMFGPVKGGLCRLTIDGGIAVKVPTGWRFISNLQDFIRIRRCRGIEVSEDSRDCNPDSHSYYWRRRAAFKRGANR